MGAYFDRQVARVCEVAFAVIVVTECPDQQVQNVVEAVRKQYGCEVRVPRSSDVVLTSREIGAFFWGFIPMLILVMVVVAVRLGKDG